MAGRILLDAANPALDDDGYPISGSTLLFRAAGTTDPLDVYTTIDLTTEHPNPLVADDAARFPQIWAADDVFYDIVWKDGQGVTIKTLYNVGVTGAGGSGSTVFEGDNVSTTTNGGVTTVTFRPFQPVAFQAGLANDITVPISNGYGSNGGWYITFDSTLFDTHGGLNLAFEYGGLPNASVQSQFYDTSTVYEAQLPGIYEVNLSVFMTGSNQNNMFQCGVSIMDADGTDIWADPADGSDWAYNSPVTNLASSTGIFDNGSNIAGTFMVPLTEGQMLRPWFVRGVNSATMTISSYTTAFSGKRVAPLLGFEVASSGDELFWADFANRHYRSDGTTYTEAETVSPDGGALKFRGRGLLSSESANSKPLLVEDLWAKFGEFFSAGCILTTRFSLNGMATLHDAPFEHNILTYTGAETDGGSAASFSIKVLRDGSDYSFKVSVGSNDYTQSFGGTDGEYQLALRYEAGSHCDFSINGGAVSENTPSATTIGQYQPEGEIRTTGATADGAFSEHYLAFVSLSEVPNDITSADLMTYSRIPFDPHSI